MKFFPLLAAVGFIAAGCTSSTGALMSNGFGAMAQQMSGAGTMMQRPDGTQGFRYVIQSNAYDGIPGDPEQLRMDALARWMGNTQNCPKGYAVDTSSVKTVGFGAENIIYEGRCK